MWPCVGCFWLKKKSGCQCVCTVLQCEELFGVKLFSGRGILFEMDFIGTETGSKKWDSADGISTLTKGSEVVDQIVVSPALKTT